MSDIEIGQVLYMKIRYNNSGEISNTKHPYIVIRITKEYIEIVQVDSLEGKWHKAAFKSNFTIINDDPKETVISKDSYAQLDNIIRVENFDQLAYYRTRKDKLNDKKLKELIRRYINYQLNNEIDENKQVYMSREELNKINNT